MSQSNSPVGVVLIHGLTGTPTEMKIVARHLESRGHRVSSPTLAGHGKGHVELLATGWRDWLGTVKDSFDGLAKECREVYVVGLCASSLLATLLAADDRRVAGIVLLSSHYGEINPAMPRRRLLLPLVYPFPFLRKRFYWTEAAPYGLKDPELQALITAAIEDSRTRETADHGTFRTYVESLYQSDLLAKEVRRRAKDVTCRALLIHSLEDTWFTPQNSVRLAMDLGTEDKTVLMITGCNHVITVDLRKHDVADFVVQFVEQKSVTIDNRVVRGTVAGR